MIEIVVGRHGGVARRSQLLASTARSPRSLDRELARLVAEGVLVRPRRGLVALPEVPAARIAAVSVGGEMTCVSAAEAWELPLLEPPSRVHVAVPRDASGKVRRMVPEDGAIHWEAAGVQLTRGRPDPARLFRHLVVCVPHREAVAAADAALRRGIVSRAELEALRPRSRWLAYERLLRAADPGSQSLGESFARVALVSAGFTVATQVQLAGAGRVDMIVNGVVVVEIDGFAYHSGRREFREDRRRDRAITIRHGLPVLRFSHEDAVFATERLVEDVRSAVTRHG